MRALLLISLFFNYLATTFAFETVTYYTSDSLKITADLYLKSYELPFILLFHGADGSRGEFNEISERFLKLGYNCLAPDLRVGYKSNFISNETAERAHSLKYSHNFIDCKKDIAATIKYVEKFNDKPIILFGSSFSGSLCLIIGQDNKRVNSIIAFSPGEFFRPEVIVKEQINGLSKPIFVSATSIEYAYILELLSGISEENKTIFSPEKGKGLHGTNMLNSDNESSKDCWLELMLFFKKIKNQY